MFWMWGKRPEVFKPSPVPMYSSSSSPVCEVKLLQLRDLIAQKEFLVLRASRDTNNHNSTLCISQYEEELEKIQPKIDSLIKELSGD